MNFLHIGAPCLLQKRSAVLAAAHSVCTAPPFSCIYYIPCSYVHYGISGVQEDSWCSAMNRPTVWCVVEQQHTSRIVVVFVCLHFLRPHAAYHTHASVHALKLAAEPLSAATIVIYF